ncbi:MAG: protein phosphatase 2C domain-containing protein [Nanoarchaeota archaeon]
MKKIEIKFDLETKDNKEILLADIIENFKADNWQIISKRKYKASINDYDTLYSNLYKNHVKLRRILKSSKNKTRFRYNYKLGDFNDRYEIKKEFENLLSSNEVKKFLSLKISKELYPIINVLTDHQFITFSKNNTKMKLKMDFFRIFEDMSFYKLEMEFLEGNQREFLQISKYLEKKFNLTRIYQKYNQIINLVGLCSNKDFSGNYPKIQINYIHDKGSCNINEDSYLIGDNIFGVFDGATSLAEYVDDNSRTGGLLASTIAKKTFEKNDQSLKDLAIRANERIKEKMISNGIDINKKINMWSTSAAVVKLTKDSIDWLQIGDSLILVIFQDNSYQLLVQDYDHDQETLAMWRSLTQKRVKNIRDKLKPQFVKVRNGMNINYGILNGENKMLNFLNRGSFKLKDVKHIVLFTDGLFIPKENLKHNNFNKFVNIFLKGGIEEVKDYVRNLENQDPDCHRYPRFKQHDDIAAISLTFNS